MAKNDCAKQYILYIIIIVKQIYLFKDSLEAHFTYFYIQLKYDWKNEKIRRSPKNKLLLLIPFPNTHIKKVYILLLLF